MPVNFPRRSGRYPQRPEMFEAWTPRFPTANSALTGAANELVKGYRAYCEQYSRTMADETITPGAREVKNAKAARAKLVPLIEAMEAASERASAVAADLNAKLTSVFDPPNKGYEMVMRHQEIRAYLKSLPQGEKLKVMEAARTGGDEDTLIALASTQPFLSGLPPQMHQMARDHLIEVHAPKEAALLKDIAEQQKYTAQLRDTMTQSVADMVDFARADELMAAAASELA